MGRMGRNEWYRQEVLKKITSLIHDEGAEMGDVIKALDNYADDVFDLAVGEVISAAEQVNRKRPTY